MPLPAGAAGGKRSAALTPNGRLASELEGRSGLEDRPEKSQPLAAGGFWSGAGGAASAGAG